MSITDELREHIESDCVHCGGRKDLLDIADRIDAEHMKALHDAIRNALANGVKSGLRQIADTHMPLPVDADGVPWRIGDRTESGQTIKTMVLSEHGWYFCGTVNEIDPTMHCHYHEPTVEDVLRGVVTLCHNTWKEGLAFEFYDVDDVMNSGNIADFAAKLQLREDA